ncbi:MAG: discoidin domain-containing protein [Opitutales bacterium]
MHSDFAMGLPPFSLVTASSEASLSRCDEAGEAIFGPDTFSQLIPVGRNEIETISVLLMSRGFGTAQARARVFACKLPGDNRSNPAPGRLLKDTTLSWDGSGHHWIDWEVKLTPLSGMKVGHYIRVELDLPEDVGWVRNQRFEPAFPAVLTETKEEPYLPTDGTTFCFRVSPAQPCFWPVNVLPETAGANRFTGVWKSDPTDDFPQWIDVSWKDPFLIEGLELDFPNSPECPVSYRLEVSAQNGEAHTVQIDQNDSHRPGHAFDPAISADRVRIVFFSTCGSPAVSMNRIQVRRRP